MGSVDGLPDERPVRRVWLDAFAMAMYPVTNAEYQRFVAATGRRAPGAKGDVRFADPAQPVVAVTWFEAVRYCEWLSEATGICWRLPTEAEREKAALGGVDGARYPWGEDLPRDAAGPRERPDRVGLGPANGYGLHNLGDLVHEWCSDWYAADAYATATARDPIGPANGTRRVSRGGSWRHRIRVTRCAARSSLQPEGRYSDYGFRVVRSGGGDADRVRRCGAVRCRWHRVTLRWFSTLTGTGT
jgi:formylglycine-generating enzyme required for sulfatase activity